jgi:hypothetical protein
MIEARPGETFTASAGDAPTGLVGTIGVRIENSDGTNHTPRTTAGIVELEPGSGAYVKTGLVAPTEAGTYQILWDTGGVSPLFSDPEELKVGYDLPAPLTPGSYTPSTGEIAAHLRARLKEPGDFEPEDFTANTRPTQAQVEVLAAQGDREVGKRIGRELCQAALDEGLDEDARAAAAIWVAMLIEQSYYPEQTRNAGSSFQSLYQLWKDSIKALTEAVGERCGTGDGDAVGGEGQRPSAFFDDNALIGRNYPAW